MNATMNLQIKKLADLDAAVPGLGNVWRELKARIGTRCRCPKSLTIREAPAPMHLNDGECGARAALDLATMTLSEHHRVASGEWACHGATNHDQAVGGVPTTSAILDVVWHDYYRYAGLTLQVADGAIRRQVNGSAESPSASGNDARGGSRRVGALE